MANISNIETPDGSEYILKDAIARAHLSYFGTCSTAAATAAKVVVVDEDSFELQPGVIVGVKFSVSNTADDVTLNVNNTGAKDIYYNNAVYNGHNTSVTGYANRTIFYMYDGTHWVFLSQATIDSNTDIKVRQTLVSGDANRPLLMAYSANTVTTTNVDNVSYRNNDIYANPSTGKIHATGFVGDLEGDASTVGGHTVSKDVPSDADFSDTKVNQVLDSAIDINRPLLLAYGDNTNTDAESIHQTYRNNSIYANPLTGNLSATMFNGVKIENIYKTYKEFNQYTTATSWKYSGNSLVVPSGYLAILYVYARQINSVPNGICLSKSSTNMSVQNVVAYSDHSAVSVNLPSGTYYIWTKYASAAKNGTLVTGLVYRITQLDMLNIYPD